MNLLSGGASSSAAPAKNQIMNKTSSSTTAAKPTKVRLILPGGGVQGSFQLGFIKGLQQSDAFEVDHVYGTSVGAMIAPFALHHDIDTMISIFDGISSITDIFQPWPWYLHALPAPLRMLLKKGAYKSNKLAEEAVRHLSTSKSYERCSVVSWDLLNKKNTWFSGEDIKKGIPASSNLWLVVPPLKMDGSIFVDGGATRLVPLPEKKDDMFHFDGLYVIVDCAPRKPQPVTKQPADVVHLMKMLHYDASLQLANKEVDRFRADNTVVDIVPQNDVFNGGLDIDRAKMNTYFDMGKAAFEQFAHERKSH